MNFGEILDLLTTLAYFAIAIAFASLTNYAICEEPKSFKTIMAYIFAPLWVPFKKTGHKLFMLAEFMWHSLSYWVMFSPYLLESSFENMKKSMDALYQIPEETVIEATEEAVMGATNSPEPLIIFIGYFVLVFGIMVLARIFALISPLRNVDWDELFDKLS